MSSVKATACCEGHWRPNPSTRWEDFEEGLRSTTGTADNVELCRASIGAKVVTVWLPKGAVIRLRRSRMDDTKLSFRYVYGQRRDNLIKITVTPGEQT